MEDNLTYTREYWDKFINQNIIDSNINLEVRESWIRCKNRDLNPFEPRIEDASKKKLNEKTDENKDLISIARPIMDNLYRIVSGSGFVMVLTDREGCIIDITGDIELINKENLYFEKGIFWNEKSMGTNAIAMAIDMDKPVQIVGAEHYYVNNHYLTCSAAPIHNEDGQVIGCINMSGSYIKANSHTTGIVVSGAYSIEKQFSLIKSNKFLNVMFKSMSEGMLVLDSNLRIRKVNDMALKILGVSEDEILESNINSLLKNISSIKSKLESGEVYHNLDCRFDTKNKIIRCIVNAFPININGKIENIVVAFNDEIYMQKVVNSMVGFNASYKFEDIITENDNIKENIRLAKRAALTNCNILIEGPSGTGKELFAQSIHNYSKRSGGPFVAVNCASIPKELMESELFGYEKGAFTGATKEGHPGKFELANGGTIFLDEIGELPLDMQSKLLRVLDNNKITRLGGTYEKILDVRIIAATNRNLALEIKNKSFREDLYYRLNVISIKTIPLKERKEDIEVLARHFVNCFNLQKNNVFKRLSSGYINAIKKYDWPGNVRELRNVVERSYYLCETDNITEELLFDYIVKSKCVEPQNNVEILSIKEVEKNSIYAALKANGGDIVKASHMLNISRATIYRKIKKYDIKIK